MPRDPNTLSNYDDVRTTHVVANFEIDFEKKRLVGSVLLKLKSLTDNLKSVVLDTSYLDIESVGVEDRTSKFTVAPRSEPYGSPLTIQFDKSISKGEEIEIDISLSTTSNCTALQWMTPEQTPNKKQPYMFSQCQAIHARSVLPSQDTPDVKATVDFNFRSPLPVVASGLPTGAKDYLPGKDGKPGTMLYTFKQEIPIPSYLFAVASGDLASASIGPRSTVWTGPEELKDCQWELEDDMERFMEAAESIVYPYAWTQYNALILPNSFPYGGMENPIFTFATPTIISKDRQNIDVIAHELSHSWSGNLVSNASWEHFWLNEGWTTYLERRIQAAVHGEPHRGFSAIIGWKALQDSIERFGEDNEYTKLVVDLKGKDPDDAFSSVPYEKGFVFLYHLENLIGKTKWDKFIPHYFETFRMKSLDSFEFKKTLIDFFASDAEASKKLKDLDWDKWLFSPGYPPKPDYDESMVKACYALSDAWESRSKGSKTEFTPKPSDIDGWVANQSVVFLERLQGTQTLSAADIELMGKTYAYDTSSNVELVSRFYVLALKAKCHSFYKPTAELLGTVGRMKFVRPLYRCLNEVDRDLAIKTFLKNKEFYHPICRQMVEKDLFS
ncbi:leukotriene A-4 hydrolase [Rhizodiscina lignyota]|uniref:Leukotriene A(4) hydrolase n=1 Tax=Rhizodiscina lignyota TaxID=1504668 RepID=A0A9P4M213_9PEZI|nr:leukotriene A-4 hydrolase [Rhizodiscina lignyota]